MHTFIATLTLAAEEQSEKSDFLPHLQELIVGTLAFLVLFFFMAKFVFPRVNRALEERQRRIQGDLERAEQQRGEADRLLAEYRQQLAGAREESNRIIEDARRTAESMRADMLARAEREHNEIVARAQEDIRAERDRVLGELRGRVAELSVELAGRVVGDSMDRERQLRLVDDYIEQLGVMTPSGDGSGSTSSPGARKLEG